MHVDGAVNPARDVETINTELIFKDLDTVEKAIDRTQKMIKTGNKEAIAKVALCERAKELLLKGTLLVNEFTEEELDGMADLFLITAKKVLFVANVDEDGIHEDNAYVTALKELAALTGSHVVKICGKIESEIAGLDPAERGEFLSDLGLAEPGLGPLAREIYSLLGLQTYFTSGPEENRAWTIHKGDTAPKAAGVIHTDFEKGFIKADVYSIEDLEQYRTEVALRAAGKIRMEGREYVVRDGDIMFFKFNV